MLQNTCKTSSHQRLPQTAAAPPNLPLSASLDGEAEAVEDAVARACAESCARIGEFETHPRIAIACSGGGDSLALLLLLKAWTHRRQGSVVALICDHGVRAESAQESRMLAQRLQKEFAIPAVLLQRGAKHDKRGNKQQNMRNFRFDACQNWCRENHVRHLAFGHTRDDQAETFLLRLARGSGVRGLGAMKEVRFSKNADSQQEAHLPRIIRPLLDVSRQDLRAWLSAQGIAWLEDRSNASSRYARNRLRLCRAVLDDLEVDSSNAFERETRKITATCAHLRRAEDALCAGLAEFCSVHVRLFPSGYAHIAGKAFLRLHQEYQLRLLSGLALSVGGRRARFDHIFEQCALLCDLLQKEELFTLSLGRTTVFAQKRNFCIARANIAMPCLPLSLSPSREKTLWDGKLWDGKLWDGRFRLILPVKTHFSPRLRDNSSCRALGRHGIAFLRRAVREVETPVETRRALEEGLEAFEALPARVRLVLPAIFNNERLCAVPTLNLYLDGMTEQTCPQLYWTALG